MDNFKFKDVEMAFDYRKLAHYDQEYLRTMTFETIMSDFNSQMDSTASHLLHNKKYWLAWTYSSDDEE